jgi:pSer/pThr/pTyr-binding forkhead associated (FHA) protein
MFNVGDRTVIGADTTADITIAGNAGLEKSPVTIVKDPDTGKFTILSENAVLVNNRRVTRKGLESGDVINFNGTIAVFDDAEPGKGSGRKKTKP